jgi:hypothetical protein
VFTLSAKLEMEMRPDSGFGEFRDYLRGAIEGGEVWRMKVEGASHTIRVVMANLLGDLRREKEAIAEECAFYRELLGKVKAREANAASLKTLILGKLSATYSGLVRDAEDEFAEGFKMKNLLVRAVPFRRTSDLRTWLAQLQAKFQDAVRRQVDVEGPRLAKGLFEEMQWMRDELTNGIKQRQEHVRENVIVPDTAVRLKMLGDLRSRFEHIPVGGEINVSSNVAEASEVRRFALAGSAMAVLGIVVVALSAVPWFDIAGTIFAVIGIVLFAAGLIWRRAAILHDFREGLRASRDQFQNRLQTETSDIIEELFSDVRHALTDAVFRLEVRASHLDAPLAETFQIGEAADEMVLRSQHAAMPGRLAQT